MATKAKSNNSGTKITEWRGVSDLVYAKLIEDSTEQITYSDVKEFVGVATISKTTEVSNESHYYDNVPAVVISSTASDEITITASAIPLNVLADITGQYYDETTGMLVEGEREAGQYFAIGYKTQKTDGTEVFVWRYKGMFNIPDQEHNTQDDGTDANGSEIIFTGISTTHKFTKTGKKATGIQVDTSINKSVDADTFFGKVTTPDDMGTTTPTV